MNKFYIGQKIVAIKDHSQGIFKKGDEFTVLGIKSFCCYNGIDIGIRIYHNTQSCDDCGTIHYKNCDVCHFDECVFAPIELSTTTFEDVIKQFEPCLN